MRRTVLLLCLLACSKSKSDEPPPAKTTEPPAATKPAEPKAEPVPAIAKPTGMFACKAKDPAGQMAKAPAGKDPWALPFTFAGCAAIPPVFGKAEIGMDEAAAKKAVPGSKVEDHIGYLYLGHHPHRQQFAMHFSDAGKLEEFAFNIDTKQFDDMKAALGAPVELDVIGDKELLWYNPAAKLREMARPDKISRGDDDVDGYRISVGRYLPLSDLLGAAVLGAPIVGKNPDELAATFPDNFEAKSKEQNHADLAKVGVDKDTMKKVDALGAAGDTVSLKFPPNEVDAHQTLVQLDMDKGKVTGYTVILNYGKDKVLRDELLAQIAASLGAPTGTHKELDDLVYTFKGPNNLVVEVGPGILKEEWHIRVKAK